MRNINVLYILIIGSLLLIFISCSSNSDRIYEYEADLGDFELERSADSVKSYPGGGGVFIIKLDPDSVFNNSVSISINADEVLNADLTELTISNGHPITEISIQPGTTENETFPITVTGTCESLIKTVDLTVLMYDAVGDVPQQFIDARDEIIGWVVTHHPEHSELDAMEFSSYKTSLGAVYGSTNWEFLNDTWHLRLAIPTSIDPPATMYLRYRGEWDYVLTVRKNPDGSIEEL